MIVQTRNRTQQQLSSMPYFSSLSLRKASHALEPIIKRSHVAVWKWIQKHSFVLDSFDADKKYAKVIFIDETEIKS
jgi:hypothetical protein